MNIVKIYQYLLHDSDCIFFLKEFYHLLLDRLHNWKSDAEYDARHTWQVSWS